MNSQECKVCGHYSFPEHFKKVVSCGYGREDKQYSCCQICYGKVEDAYKFARGYGLSVNVDALFDNISCLSGKGR